MKRNRINETIDRTQAEGRVAFIGLVPIEAQSLDKSKEIADMMKGGEPK